MITTNCLSFMWLTCDQAVLLRQLSRSPRKKKTPDRRLPERLQPGKYHIFSFIQYTSCILFDVTLHSLALPAGQICTFSRRFFPKVKAKSCLDGKHYMVAHHIVVQHKLIEHCAQRLVSSTHFSKLLFSVLSTPRLSLVSFYVLLCPY